MYAPSFDYYRARSVADAHQLLAAHPGAKLLAGGHSLVPLLKLRLAAPSALVDIGRIPELRGISRQGDAIRIGALATHAELAASADLRNAAPALADAAAMVGDPAVRNRGTIGGNVAHADPASDLPTVLVALDARILASGPGGERTIAADQFFTGIMTTGVTRDLSFETVRVSGNRVTLETATAPTRVAVELTVTGADVTGTWQMGAMSGSLRGKRLSGP